MRAIDSGRHESCGDSTLGPQDYATPEPVTLRRQALDGSSWMTSLLSSRELPRLVVVHP